MIELRWLVKMVTIPTGMFMTDQAGKAIPLIQTQEVTQLQYRERIDSETVTEWQDAPTVREP